MTMRNRLLSEQEDVATYTYHKLSLHNDCSIQRTAHASQQYLLDNIQDSIHAAILSLQLSAATTQEFIRQAIYLKTTAKRQPRHPFVARNRNPFTLFTSGVTAPPLCRHKQSASTT